MSLTSETMPPTRRSLLKIIESNMKLRNIPITAEVNFGHTTPKITFPIGGEIEIDADENSVKLTILKH